MLQRGARLTNKFFIVKYVLIRYTTAHDNGLPVDATALTRHVCDSGEGGAVS